MDVQVGVAELPDLGVGVHIPVVRVVLSERNLRALLLSIDEENNDVSRIVPEQGVLLIIAAEPNEVHYKEREAGLMSEDLELKMAAEELSDDQTLVIPPDMKLQ